MAQHPLRIQIQEVERELRMRAEVYPRLVLKGKLRQAEAEELTARMQSVLETLKALQEDRS